MKPLKSLIAAAMCLCMLLCLVGCGKEDSSPTIPTAGTTAPTVPATEPTDYRALYQSGAAQIQSASDLVVTYTYQLNTIVGGETYLESRSGTASYLGRTTENMEALVSENLTYGGYSTTYIESYISGSAYVRVNNCSFACHITDEEFLSQQIPAVLLDQALYSDVHIEDGSMTFRGAEAAESWLSLDENATLVTATGNATLDATGKPIASSYHAEYTLGTTRYTLDVSVSIQLISSELSTKQPVYGENCPTISDLHIPRYVLRTVGSVYAAQAVSASSSDTLYSQAYAVIRNQNSTYDMFGSDESFLAKLSSQVGITDYIGNTNNNSQTAIYQNGLYSSSVNGGESTSDSSITAQQVRTSCEDSILSALLKLDSIASAELTDTGDFLCIRFKGNDAFAQEICNSIYRLFTVDLDSFAQSHTTEAAGGYLTINKHTGLPTAMGMNVSRNHIIDKVSYQLTYQLDQSLTLSSPTAYENITGQAPVEETEDSAAPLFYKVTGPDGQIMYLLGTIHVGDGRTGNLPQQILDAFSASDALAVEFNTNAFEAAAASDPTLQSQLAAAYYHSSSTIQQQLSKDLYARLYPLMLATGANSANSSYLKIVIWSNQIENFYLQQSYGLTASRGMDQRLLDWAAQQDKVVYEVESGLFQIQMLTGFSKELQTLLLTQTLDTGMVAYYADTQRLYELWCQGDEAALTQAIAEMTTNLTEAEQKLYNEYNKAMYTERNKAMLNKAISYLDSGETVFYAVGLAHLLGEEGLVTTLRNAGYTVEIVAYQ